MSNPILNCGFVPLVDCAPLVVAREMGFAHKEGLELLLHKQPSWSALRDHLALGALEAAQAETVLGNRVAYAETLGQGKGVLERGKGAWTGEISALRDEVTEVLAEA